jgi:hypothetical protein
MDSERVHLQLKGANNKYMTKAKAVKLMNEYCRQVIDPALARDIAQAFGYTLSKLGLKARKVSSFHRLNYSEETKDLTAIEVYELARGIATQGFIKTDFPSREEAEKYGEEITSKFPNLYLSLQYEGEPDTANKFEAHFGIGSGMNGAGSYAQDITEKALEVISKK